MTYDVAVIGAGLNGLTTALALASPMLRRPLRIILIDARAHDVPVTDTRGSALTRATQQMLQTLGVWDALALSVQEMRQVRVTDGGDAIAERPALLRFASAENEPTTASIVENGVLLQTLRNAVLALPDVEVAFGSIVTGFEFGPGPARVTLANGRVIRAALVAAADGRGSKAREAAGIGVDRKDYGQSALTFTIAHSEPHHGQAEEHFLSGGVLAVLPLTGNRSSIVWADTAARALDLMAMTVEDFTATFHHVLGPHLGHITLESQRNSYPLALQIARELVSPRLALVGDAAHVIHPLAGLGLNLGFKDAAALSEVLADASAIGEDIGSVSVLERYVQKRRFDTVRTTYALDAMNSLFANANPLLTLIRGLGLRTVDRLPLAKAFFMREAAGLNGVPPKLMRGLVP